MAQELDFAIGTYPSNEGGKGIYSSRLNLETGAMSDSRLVAEAPAPSFLAYHPNGRWIYAVHEFSGGDVGAYEIRKDDSFKLLNIESGKAGGPCHIAMTPDAKWILTASYGEGKVSSLPIREDGSLGKVADVFSNEGSGPDKSRQEGPHMHAVVPFEKLVYACDLGTDEVLAFRLDEETGRLEKTKFGAKAPAGGGPRHLVVHPTGKSLFVNNEMGNSVSSYRRSETGALQLLQTLSTLPEGAPKSGSTSEILLHPNHKWLYVSNRGHDSIAVFKVTEDGKMSLVEIEPAGVKNPRGMALEPKGRWLVVGGQDSGNVVSLKVDGETGKIALTGSKIAVPKPVSIHFPPEKDE